MAFAFMLLLSVLVALLTAHLLRRLRGNYLLCIFQFLFSFFTLYGFGLYDARTAIGELYGSDVLPLCWCVVLLGLSGVAIGYRMFPMWNVPRWRYLRVPVRISRLGIAGMLLLVAGVAGELMFVNRSGGAQAYYSISRGGGSYETTTAYVYYARWFWIPGIAFLAAAGTERRRWRPAAVAGLVLLGAYNLMLGQRTGIYLAVLSTLYVRAVWRRRLPKVATILAALGVAAVLMGFMALTRGDYHLNSSFLTTRKLLEKPPGEVLKETTLNNVSGIGYGPDNEMVLFAGLIRVFPQVVDYDYFKYYTSFLYSWIPRMAWPSRPGPTRDKLLEGLSATGADQRSGPTPTMLGMFYMHFGVVSVLLLSFLTGLFLAFIDANGLVAFGNPSAAVVFISMAGAGLSMPMGMGVFASLPILLPFTVVPVVVGLWWARDPRCVTRAGRRRYAASTSAGQRYRRVWPMANGTWSQNSRVLSFKEKLT